MTERPHEDGRRGRRGDEEIEDPALAGCAVAAAVGGLQDNEVPAPPAKAASAALPGASDIVVTARKRRESILKGHRRSALHL